MDLGLALTGAGMAGLIRRDYEAAREVLAEAERLVARKDDAHLLPRVLLLRGRLQIRDGEVEEGLALLRRGIDAWRSGGTRTMVDRQLKQLVEACPEAGQVELGLEAVREAMELLEESEAQVFRADFHRLESELLLMRGEGGEVDEAEARFLKAIEVARRQEAKLWELRAASSLARLWGRQGRQREARGLLTPVYNWFTEGFDTPDLVDARRLLAEL